MKTEEFARRFADYINGSECIRDFDSVFIIVNPAAGGFTRKRFFHDAIQSLQRAEVVRQNRQPVENAKKMEILYTDSAGHCESMVRRIVETAEKDERVLFVTTGGDGTATEAASGLYKCSRGGVSIDRFVLFRLPLGTGNDGLDAADMDEAFSICRSKCGTLKIPLLEISTSSDEKIYATNIASFGLDAYVTRLSNNLKERIPGSFYSIMVDVAALFYEKSVDPAPFTLQFTNERGYKKTVETMALLLAMGVSGHRNYGKGKKVLPDANNVCIVGRMPFFRKFSVKNLLYKGEHTQLREVTMYSAQKMVFDFPASLLFQYDGEVHPFQKEDFPVTVQVLPPTVSVLRPVTSLNPSTAQSG